MKKLKFIIFAFLFIATVSAVVFVMYYNNGIKAVDINSKEEIEVIIPQGTTSNGAIKILNDKGLIKCELCAKIYLKINKVGDFKASTYKLSKSMDLKEIILILEKGNSFNANEIKITFIEGLTIKKYADIISKNTNNTIDDVLNLIKDEKYLDELIKKYWFITDDIKNPKIYYSLEGYLFPDTYIFRNKDVSVKEIFEKMLNQTEAKLSKYKDELIKNKVNMHQLLTLASIVEQEGSNLTNKKGIARVFLNRIDKNMSLGSDVTTYYGLKLDLKDHGIVTKEQYNTPNDYNTRATSKLGLPIGPICFPSMDALEASINPEGNDYLYFIADKNRKIYFHYTLTEQNAKIEKLRKEGLWLY